MLGSKKLQLDTVLWSVENNIIYYRKSLLLSHSTSKYRQSKDKHAEKNINELTSLLTNFIFEKSFDKNQYTYLKTPFMDQIRLKSVFCHELLHSLLFSVCLFLIVFVEFFWRHGRQTCDNCSWQQDMLGSDQILKLPVQTILLLMLFRS